MYRQARLLVGCLRRPETASEGASEPRERSGAMGPHEGACRGSAGRSPPERIMFKEFKAFVNQGNALDLAIGVIIGAAFGKIVNSIVNAITTNSTTAWMKVP